MAIRASFVYIKENLIFESVKDELHQKGLLPEENENNHKSQSSRQSSVERLIKFLISKDKCSEFIEILSKTNCHGHVYNKIQENRPRTIPQINTGNIVNSFSSFKMLSKLSNLCSALGLILFLQILKMSVRSQMSCYKNISLFFIWN